MPVPPASGTGDPWDVLGHWSEAIRECIFDGRCAGRPVYLDLEDDVIAEIAIKVGVEDDDPEQALAHVVKPTLNLGAGTPPLLQDHARRTAAWRRAGSGGSPPFLPILAFMSSVAEGMRSDGEFRASNYYGRFCQAVGLEPSTRLQTKISNGFIEHSLLLWGALNEWLEEHHGALGLPTAFAFDSRTYVGLPLSQALVRDADRRRFPDLFATYRLRPGQVISRTDMARLLGDWVVGSRLSSGLKGMIERQDEVAARIADVACVELQAWDGALTSGLEPVDRGPASLLLAAQLRTQPLSRLYLDLGVESPGMADGPYGLGEGASAHAEAALSALGDSVTLAAADQHGWRSLERSADISFADLLLADVTLREQGSESALRRPARRLVVLEYDDELRRFTEVPRIQLGTTNLVLCHESLAPTLRSKLEDVARPDWRCLSGEDLHGVPEGWIVLTPVQVLSISDTEDVDLMALVPLSWTQIALGAGFSLPGRLTWLAEDPPEVRVSSAEGETLLVTLHRERFLDGAEAEDHDLGRFLGQGAVKVPGGPPGDYRIMLRDAAHPRAAPLASTLLRLRSASHPRLILSDEEPPLTHHLSGGLGVLSAGPGEESPQADGALVSGWSASTLDSVPDAPSTLEFHGREAEDQEEDLPAPSGAIQGGPTPGCLLKGAHHFVLPYFGPDVPRAARVEGICKECGLEQNWPTRPRRRKGRGGNVSEDHEEHEAVAPRDLRPVLIEDPADWDRLLRALSYVGRGSWSAFEAMAAAVENSPWFAIEAARSLSALGHLNLRLDPRTLRPLSWSMAPATIALTAERQAALCGLRCAELGEVLAPDIEILGGTLSIDPVQGAPALFAIEGLGADELAELVAAVEGLPWPLELSIHPAESLAALLPDLGRLMDVLPTLDRPPDLPTELFDFEQGKWLACDGVDRPGAYRFRDRPFRYCVQDGAGGPLRLTDNRLAKWLGARELGLALLAHDPGLSLLSCPLGARLPGLYERAAVLASGQPPTHRRGGTVTYTEVPAGLAARIWDRVGPGVER